LGPGLALVLQLAHMQPVQGPGRRKQIKIELIF